MRIEGPVFVLQTSEQSPDIGPSYWNQPVGVTVQGGGNRLIIMIKFNAALGLSRMKGTFF